MSDGRLKIQQKWEDMAAYTYIVLRNMPKSERFTLGAEIREAVWRGVRMIVRANYSRDKRALLMEIDTEIKTIQALIRVGHSLQIVDHKKYELLSARLCEIGRMLGGWLKTQNTGLTR